MPCTTVEMHIKIPQNRREYGISLKKSFYDLMLDLCCKGRK
jgi:hypothetical protein